MNHNNVKQFIKMLTNLENIIVKAEQHADAHKFDANLFTQDRLAVDMLNFTKQVQIACDNAKFCVALLSHQEPPKFEDNEKTMGELKARIQKTIAFLSKNIEADFSKYKDAKYAPVWAGGQWLDGETYFNEFAFANFYFHLTTAYGILRKSGVNIGKSDYMGSLPFKK